MTFNAGIEAAALKPCMFCKSIEGPHLYTIEDGDGHVLETYIECEDCQARGPVAANGVESTSDWNALTRPSSNAQEDRRTAVIKSLRKTLRINLVYDGSKIHHAEIRDENLEAVADAILSLPGSSRDEVLEEAAKVAECAGCGDPKCSSCYGNQIASAIRALKSGGAK